MKNNIIVLPDLSLSSLMHLPQFSFNFVHISYLTKIHSCCVTFFPSRCVLQDLRTGQTIGGGREHNDLYDGDKSAAVDDDKVLPLLVDEDSLEYRQSLRQVQPPKNTQHGPYLTDERLVHIVFLDSNYNAFFYITLLYLFPQDI